MFRRIAVYVQGTILTAVECDDMDELRHAAARTSTSHGGSAVPPHPLTEAIGASQGSTVLCCFGKEEMGLDVPKETASSQKSETTCM